MGFPFVLSVPDAEVYRKYTDRRGLTLGQLAITSDGRRWRWALNGAALLVAGDVLQASAPITNHILQTPTTAGVIGDATLIMTIGNTALTVDQYRDGVLSIELGTGFGYAYALDRHINYAGSATTVAIPFKAGVKLQAAVPTTSNSVSFIPSPYSSVKQFPVTTATSNAVGIACAPIPASGTPPATPQYGWIQVGGLAAVTTDSTVVIGQNVSPPSAAAGAVLATATDLKQVLGWVSHVATDTNKSVIFLNLP